MTDESDGKPRCWNVWRGTVNGRYVLDTRASSRTPDPAIARAWAWQALGVPVVVASAGFDPNAASDGWTCESDGPAVWVEPSLRN